MREQLEKTIRTNLQTTINHLHEQKDLVSNRISLNEEGCFFLLFLFFNRKRKIVLLNIQIN